MTPLTKDIKLSDDEMDKWKNKLICYGKIGRNLEEIELVLHVDAEYKLEDILVSVIEYLSLIEAYHNYLYNLINKNKRVRL